MARKPDTDKKMRYYDHFPRTLRDLMEENGTTQEQLREVLGLSSRQAITGYMNGSTLPTSDKLYAIAKYFNVSSDYLIGLSEIETSDIQTRAVIEDSGLSEDAVENLLDHIPGTQKLLSLILESRYFLEEMGNKFDLACEAHNRLNTIDEVAEAFNDDILTEEFFKKHPNRFYPCNNDEMEEVFIHRTVKLFEEMLREALKNGYGKEEE